MSKIISVISGKGGVGKTTLVSNLGSALTKHGKSVVVIDGNVTTPNLSLHLGIPFYPVTLHDALRNNMPIESAVYNHHSGMRVIPASLSIDSMEGIDLDRMDEAISGLIGSADIVIIDSAAGLGKEAMAAMNAADDLLIVTNPDLPSVTDALKTIKIAQNSRKNVMGVVVNRVRGLKHEMSIEEIKMMLEVPIVSLVPEDLSVPKSIARKVPVVHHKPKSKSSVEFQKLALKIMGEPWRKIEKRAWWERLFFWTD
ncbi:MAG: cell division ATPase MinD [Candidatus Aenigmarchaeota archaeon]|nr:cell division ATPase MinD [Candidatus Aenigmarchaeota archaeon]